MLINCYAQPNFGSTKRDNLRSATTTTRTRTISDSSREALLPATVSFWTGLNQSDYLTITNHVNGQRPDKIPYTEEKIQQGILEELHDQAVLYPRQGYSFPNDPPTKPEPELARNRSIKPNFIDHFRATVLGSHPQVPTKLNRSVSLASAPGSSANPLAKLNSSSVYSDKIILLKASCDSDELKDNSNKKT